MQNIKLNNNVKNDNYIDAQDLNQESFAEYNCSEKYIWKGVRYDLFSILRGALSLVSFKIQVADYQPDR